MRRITYVGEVGNTATNEEDLALSVHGCAEHEVENSAGVVEGLGLGGSTRVLAVVGELVSEPVGSDSIGVDDGGTTTGDHGPDTTFRVEDSELERCTRRSIELLDVRLLLCEVTTEGGGPDLRRVLSTSS